MPITYRWFNDEQTIILWQFQGSWTWTEVGVAQAAINQMVDTVPDKTVHFVLDLSDSSSLPIGTLHKVPQLIRTRHPKRGYVMMAGANYVITKLWNVFSKIIVDGD